MPKEIAEVINMTEERFRSVAPPAISYEAEKGFAMQALTNNGYLMKVAQENPASLAQAITNVAAIGLSLNPAEKQAYLIPRSIKEDGKWVSKVFLEPSYMGLCKLATDSGAIEWVQSNLVYGHDTFADNGPGERPTHSYNAFSKDRGEFVGAYCVAKTASGDFLTTIMTAEEISGIMERSETVKKYRKENNTGFGGPWITDFGEQAKKTVVRRAFKMWPQSTGDRMAQAVHISNENEGFGPIVSSPEIRDFTADQKAFYDQLITENNSIGMYVFLRSIEEGAATSLYHSFPKGEKGRYQRIVDGLYKSGEASLREYTEQIIDAGDDDLRIKELLLELPDDAIALIEPKLSELAQAIVRGAE